MTSSHRGFQVRQHQPWKLWLALALIVALMALFSPLIAPFDPYDLTQIDLMDSEMPPVWLPDADPRFLLGTDDQGRGILSTIIYGARISLGVGFASVIAFGVMGGLGAYGASKLAGEEGVRAAGARRRWKHKKRDTCHRTAVACTYGRVRC